MAGDGWTARVIKNEDDDGWAVAMTGRRRRAGAGRPLDHGARQKEPQAAGRNAFSTLVKTASEFVRRTSSNCMPR